MKSIILLIGILFLLALVVPLSSRRPDAIQHVLRLPGGVDSAPKAVMGILVASLCVWGLGGWLKKGRGK